MGTNWSLFSKVFTLYLAVASEEIVHGTLGGGSGEREVIGQLMQKISLHLMRGNAGMITSRRPEADFLPPELDGVE